jgi:hypothetical protein
MNLLLRSVSITINGYNKVVDKGKVWSTWPLVVNLTAGGPLEQKSQVGHHDEFVVEVSITINGYNTVVEKGKVWSTWPLVVNLTAGGQLELNSQVGHH